MMAATHHHQAAHHSHSSALTSRSTFPDKCPRYRPHGTRLKNVQEAPSDAAAFCRLCTAGYFTRRVRNMPVALFPTCNCMTRSSGGLGAQSEPARKSPSNFLASVTDTYVFGAKNVASWFVHRIQDKENAGASPMAKRRARTTDRSSSPSMYELDMYMYNRPLATIKPEAKLAAKPKGRLNSPHSPTSVI
jgi:hypothetical protein